MSKPYEPCPNGIHICGADEDRNEFFSEVNLPGVTWQQYCDAKLAFCAEGDDPCDFVVDFMQDGSIVDDFHITRQMAVRLQRHLGGL